MTTLFTLSNLGNSPIVSKLFGSLSAGSTLITSPPLKILGGCEKRYALTTETALVSFDFLGGKLLGGRRKVSSNVGRTRFSKGGSAS